MLLIRILHILHLLFQVSSKEVYVAFQTQEYAVNVILNTDHISRALTKIANAITAENKVNVNDIALPDTETENLKNLHISKLDTNSSDIDILHTTSSMRILARHNNLVNRYRGKRQLAPIDNKIKRMGEISAANHFMLPIYNKGLISKVRDAQLELIQALKASANATIDNTKAIKETDMAVETIASELLRISRKNMKTKSKINKIIHRHIITDLEDESLDAVEQNLNDLDIIEIAANNGFLHTSALDKKTLREEIIKIEKSSKTTKPIFGRNEIDQYYSHKFARAAWVDKSLVIGLRFPLYNITQLYEIDNNPTSDIETLTMKSRALSAKPFWILQSKKEKKIKVIDEYNKNKCINYMRGFVCNIRDHASIALMQNNELNTLALVSEIGPNQFVIVHHKRHTVTEKCVDSSLKEITLEKIALLTVPETCKINSRYLYIDASSTYKGARQTLHNTRVHSLENLGVDHIHSNSNNTYSLEEEHMDLIHNNITQAVAKSMHYLNETKHSIQDAHIKINASQNKLNSMDAMLNSFKFQTNGLLAAIGSTTTLLTIGAIVLIILILK